MSRALALSLCLILAISAAPALAKKHKKKPKPLGPVVTVTAAGNPATASEQDSTAVATCPAGKQAVGGGFTSNLSAASAVVVHDSYRSSSQAWTVVGQNVSGGGAVTAYAYCRAATRLITDVAAPIQVAAAPSKGTASMSCPAGTQLIGGGFQVPGGPGVLYPEVNSSSALNAWTVVLVNGSSGPRAGTGHAYCMKGIKAPTVVNATTVTNVVQYSSASATTPVCPAPKKAKKKGKKGKKRKKTPAQLLSAGGFSASAAIPGPVGVFGDSRIGPSGGWLATAVDSTNGVGPLTVTSQGFCV